MAMQIEQFPNGPTLTASDVAAALEDKGVVAVVVYKKGVKPLPTTEASDVFLIATAPRTAADLKPFQALTEAASQWIDSVPNGRTKSTTEIAKLLMREHSAAGAITVVVFKENVKPLGETRPEDVLFFATVLDLNTLDIFRTTEETEAHVLPVS